MIRVIPLLAALALAVPGTALARGHHPDHACARGHADGGCFAKDDRPKKGKKAKKEKKAKRTKHGRGGCDGADRGDHDHDHDRDERPEAPIRH